VGLTFLVAIELETQRRKGAEAQRRQGARNTDATDRMDCLCVFATWRLCVKRSMFDS
jgi:hypothetical protein